MYGTGKPSPKEQLDTLLQAYLTENVGGYARDS